MDAEQFRGKFEDLRTIDIALPRLAPDSPDTCPVPLKDLFDYVSTEFDDGTPKSPLQPRFLRTATIGDSKYWIWLLNDRDYGDGYAVVRLLPNGTTLSDCDETFGTTPEQCLVALHFLID